ncbi:MAG TPA: NAD-dependent epimerase/dehydratase family protein [Acidobacteriaceae bacterium]|jgi:nucleoside-diphosphate-sugar epimerase|nr:NAD-dependent epimerase/dehydratase family protein [Acidobacteriaceae bacterium]
MITILGAGGVIANHLTPLLAEQKQPFRVVSRSARGAPGAAEAVAADLTDREATIRAVAGSSVVLLLAGLPYDHKIWADQWPRIMANTIEASKRAGAKLLFFDNVYMYGRVHGAMTEDTPFRPCSRKGEIRAQIATTLLNEIRAGSLTAMIARAPDFYGPATPTGVANVLVFDAWSKNQKASWLVNDSVPHSLIYTPDAARGVLTLAASDSAWNQTWHLPTAPNPPTGREFITTAAGAMERAPEYRVLSPLMVRMYGWFKPVVGELYEMLYQNDAPYVFDSSKFARAFEFAGTPYAEGVRATAGSYRKSA